MKQSLGCGCVAIVGLFVVFMVMALDQSGSGATDHGSPAPTLLAVRTGAATLPAQVTVPSTPTFTPTPTNTPTPTPDSAELQATLDAAWAVSDWPQAIKALELLRRVEPEVEEHKAKLYAAHFSFGKSLLAKDDKSGAASEFSNARAVDPSRPEAESEIEALTPTATPAPPTLTPTAGPWMSEPVVTGDHALVAGDLRFLDRLGYFVPDREKEFVLVTVIIKNVGSSRISYGLSDFSMRGGDGVIKGHLITGGFDGEMDSGRLEPGAVAQGKVPFQINKGDRKLTLLYSPCWFSCDERQVQLKETYQR